MNRQPNDISQRSEIEVPCTRKSLEKIRSFIEKELKNIPLSLQEKNRVILAVDEACANAIIHGNKCDENKTMKLEVTVTDDTVHFKIEDVGDHDMIKPEKYGSSVAELIKERRKGGMGLKLMYSIMDEIYYYTEDNMNICSLTKVFKE